MDVLNITSRTSTLATETEWVLARRDLAVEVIAQVAIGQVEHAMRILDGQQPGHDEITKKGVAETIKYVQGCPKDHRDGWMFQVISWYANLQHDPQAFVRMPLPTATRQGFDGVSLRMSSDGSEIEYVVISEEKATLQPRRRFLKEVIPDFCALEAGERERELRPELLVLLQAAKADPTAILNTGVWKGRKRYRAAICTSNGRLPKKEELFESFDTKIPGDATKRHAHRFVHSDMRAFFEDLTQDVLQHLRALMTQASV